MKIFARVLDSDYHNNIRSPLEELGTDMVRQILIEYFHLIYLGLTKNLTQTHTIKSLISTKLLHIQKYQPPEFHRRIRPIDKFLQYKGHEFRCLLLYTGPFVLLNSIPQAYYFNFLLLHVAIRILNDSILCVSHNALAKKMLESFVDGFARIYGIEYVVSNIHLLTHLADDVMRSMPLDNMSAFKFESSICKLKRSIRSNNKPLEQLAKRTYANWQPF